MSSRTDPRPPDKSSEPGSPSGSARMVGRAELHARGGAGSAGQSAAGAVGSMAYEAGEPEGIPLLSIVARAQQLSKDYQSRLEPQLSRAYRAYNNEHALGSKYLGPAFRGRSRLFVPKTRAAVRKNLATTIGALFSTEDVVSVEAEYEDDPVSKATAATLKAALDYRLTRSSTKSGIPWYQTVSGACLDAQRTGVVISKQHWRYEEVPTGEYRPVMVPQTDDSGQPVMEFVPNPATGQMALQPVMVEGQEPVMRVVEDRPMIDLIPIENVDVDPAAPWVDPVQLGRWLFVRYPMGLSDVRSWMASTGKPGTADPGWLPNVPDGLLLKGRIDEDRSGSRRVREGGGDRYQDARSPGEPLDIVWIQENFVRVAGTDWHFWSVGWHGYLSRVRPVWEAYPELDGERPYIMGLAQIDTHRVFPMSPVESWQPLQLELNDITNLRQDTLKRAIAPLAVVKAGRNVDTVALQRRGQPEAVLTVEDPATDVVFQQTPGPTGAAYTETSVNNAMFDELAGVFSTSSVQTSRQLNETVGGMRLMSGSANAVSEYDLRTFIETWVERALRQVLHLERRLESDAKIIAIAGQKARALAEFGHMPSLSDWESVEVLLKVNAGIGALDPMQRLAKFRMAGEMLTPMMPMFEAQGIRLKGETLIEEILGAAGFKDGARFYEVGEPQQHQDPDAQKMMAQMQIEREKMAASLKELMLQIRADLMQDQRDNQTKLLIEQMKDHREVVKHVAGAVQAQQGRVHEARMGEAGRRHEAAQTREGRAHETSQAREGRSHESRKLAAQLAFKPACGPGARGAGRGGAGATRSGGRREPPRQIQDPASRQRVLNILTGAGDRSADDGLPGGAMPDMGTSGIGAPGMAPPGMAPPGMAPPGMGTGMGGARMAQGQGLPPAIGADPRQMLLRALIQQLVGQQGGTAAQLPRASLSANGGNSPLASPY